MKKELILIGAGGHAASCIDVIEQQNEFKISGLIGLENELRSTNLKYTIIGSDKDLPQFAKQYTYALVTIGQIKTPEQRISSYKKATELGLTMPTIISPLAYVSQHAKLGKGTIVMHGVIINAGAVIGNNCIINTNSLIEHGAVVEDNCHISTGAIINGNAKIQSGCFIGSGSIVREGVIIKKNSLIGMGSIVLNNLKSSTFLTKSTNK